MAGWCCLRSLGALGPSGSLTTSRSRKLPSPTSSTACAITPAWSCGSTAAMGPPPPDVEAECTSTSKQQLRFPNPHRLFGVGAEFDIGHWKQRRENERPLRNTSAPSYWTEDKIDRYVSLQARTNAGARMALTRRPAPGPAVPPIESLRTMLAPRITSGPIDDWWNFHAGGG